MDSPLPVSTASHDKRSPPTREELGILVLAPTSNDARLTANFLQKAGYDAAICQNLDDLVERMQDGMRSVGAGRGGSRQRHERS